jgi:hypothetical protein
VPGDGEVDTLVVVVVEVEATPVEGTLSSAMQ